MSKVTVQIAAPAVLDEGDVPEIGELREFDAERAEALIAEGVAVEPGTLDHPAVADGAAAEQIAELQRQIAEHRATIAAKDDQLDALAQALAEANGAAPSDPTPAVPVPADSPPADAPPAVEVPAIPAELPTDYKALQALAVEVDVDLKNEDGKQLSKAELTAALAAKRDGGAA